MSVVYDNKSFEYFEILLKIVKKVAILYNLQIQYTSMTND